MWTKGNGDSESQGYYMAVSYVGFIYVIILGAGMIT